METLNFTQFCIKNNLPSDYDTMFQAQLLGSRGLAGSVSKRSINSQDAKFHEMQSKNKEAHELFYNAVKNGEIVDRSGKLVKDEILKKEAKFLRDEISSKIKILQQNIDRIKSFGKMSHLKNGKLKKGYQLAVDDHLQKIELLKNQS